MDELWLVTDEDIAACSDRLGLRDRKGPVGDALIEFRDRLRARLHSHAAGEIGFEELLSDWRGHAGRLYANGRTRVAEAWEHAADELEQYIGSDDGGAA